MARVFDITDKLSFEENPILKIKDVEIEVNTNAMDILNIIGAMKDDTNSQSLLYMLETLFPSAESMAKIKNLKLSMGDMKVFIKEAISRVMGDDGSEGEDQTPATT